MVDRWAEVTSGRLAALDAMSQAEFDAPSWTPVGSDETYGRFMRIRHFDCFMHEHDIRFALGLPARTDGADQASCLDEVATGLGYIVGRRAAMPDGSRVVIELTGDRPAPTVSWSTAGHRWWRSSTVRRRWASSCRCPSSCA